MHDYIRRAGLATGATLCTLAVAASTAAAQRSDAGSMGSRPHAVSIGFGGGASVPTGDAKDVLKTGINGQGFVLLHLPAGLPTLRLNLGYQKFDFKDALAGGDANQEILSGVGGVSFNLLGGPVRPYITAGVGAFNVKTTLETAAREDASTSKTNFGIDGGAGVAVSFGRLSGFVEGRLQNVYTRDAGIIDTKSIRAVPVTFGLLVGL
jgi:opacity protein-like surface antigen